jgi:alpha-glucosidase (family GH31 glycosyl hydrolase)
MAQSYMNYSIPFGGFNIDSGWSTCYNDFIWNKKLFPDPEGLINFFH